MLEFQPALALGGVSLPVRKGFWICLWLVLAAGFSAAPAWAADVFKGREIYVDRCQACHGAGGEGLMAGTPNFARGESLFLTDQELASVIRAGKGVMPGFGGLLSDDDIANVVAYLRTFL